MLLPTKKDIVVFTDLDGTLLDYSTYSFEAALSALQSLKEKNIPLIICSSKTRKEIEYYREKLGNNHPFISENGGGIFIPKDYFGSNIHRLSDEINETAYKIIILGANYSSLRSAIKELKKEGLNVKGFGDMSIEEVAEMAHMSIAEAEMAKERDFDEPFIFDGNKDEIGKLIESIRQKGFSFTQGRFFHILGNSDKGRAVSILSELYRKKFGDIVTVAIGDSLNDIPMLERVDHPIIVQKPGGDYDVRIAVPKLVKAGGVGPVGWNRAVLELLLYVNQQGLRSSSH